MSAPTRVSTRLQASRPLGSLLTLFLLPASLMACKCEISYPVCNEVVASELVFIGTVESIEPAFLDPWNPKSLSLLPTGEIMRLRQEGSPASLARLKEIFLQLYPGMPDYYKEKLQSAKTHRQLEAIVDAIGAQGRQARIRVKKYFKRAENDDADHDDKDDDNVEKHEAISVWTPAGDCGYDFQKGETYLIYADSDEETERIETGSCTRTKRLTDAGDDLAYLYFRENGGDKSTRVEGFVTDEANQDVSRFEDAIRSPVPDVILELGSADGSRFARAAADGRFAFDGLSEGPYSLTVFAAEYPREVSQLAGPVKFQVQNKSCGRQILAVSKATQKHAPAR